MAITLNDFAKIAEFVIYIFTNLEKKIVLLEKKLMPKLTHLIVMVGKDENKDSALLRIMHEKKINQLPTGCLIINLNLQQSTS